MGAWGHGIFDDDTAYDYVDEIDNSDNPKEIFKNAFETAINAEYLEYDYCHAVTVSASYIPISTAAFFAKSGSNLK